MPGVPTDYDRGANPKLAGGGQARLLSRLRINNQASFSGVVPPGCAWVRIGCNGRGGNNSSTQKGYGAAYAYADGAVSPGQGVTVSMLTSGTSGGSPTTVTVGNVIASAANGGLSPGLASNSVGTLTRSGGGPNVASEFGGPSNANAGGCGGDSDKPDGLGLLGGAELGQSTSGPGGGASTGSTTGYAAAVIEFWTSNPRAA